MFKKLEYKYCMARKEFGKQTLFQDVPGHLVDHIPPNKQEQNKYILRNPVNKSTQYAPSYAEHEANTNTIEYSQEGVNHVEGGWPKEINYTQEELTDRYKRSIKHKENYINAVANVSDKITHSLEQNNAIDMYETYFSTIPPSKPKETYSIRVESCFKDPANRPISSMAWTHETETKLVVAYCMKSYTPNLDLEADDIVCYLWDINSQFEPCGRLNPRKPCWQLACAPTDPNIIVGGLDNGIVCMFDLRSGANPVAESSTFSSHRDPVSCLKYSHNRTNSEIFTGSADGQLLWWDTRNMNEPNAQLFISIDLKPKELPSFSNSQPVSALQFDRTMPTRFLCATDTGLIVNGNRMGKSHSEVLPCYWRAHHGIVREIERSPCTPRMFISCGDWTVRIWSEEVRSAPIIVAAPYKHEVNSVTWAPNRYSSYMSVCAGGMFYYWDLLRKTDQPIDMVQVSSSPLTHIKADPVGKFVATADSSGCVFLLLLSDNMVESEPYDKQQMMLMYERETRREHLIDARLRELRLKQRLLETKERDDDDDESHVSEELDDEQLDELAEQKYWAIVRKQMAEFDITPPPPDVIRKKHSLID